MKKIFTTAAMAMVAFTAVVTMSSCQNDSPSSFNASPVETVSKTQKSTSNTSSDNTSSTLSYLYTATVTNDVFLLYDVTIIRTIGTETKTYTFANAADMQNAMTTGKDFFTADNGVRVNVKATFAIKSNFQEILNKVVIEKGNEATLRLFAKPNYNFPVLNSVYRHYGDNGFGGTFIAKAIDKDTLETIAQTMGELLSPNNSK